MILLNGCSYGANWKTFPGINLSLYGGSFHRSIRTTMEYVASGNKVDAVLVPITFIHRNEYALNINADKPIEGPYINTNNDRNLHKHHNDLQKLFDSDYDAYDKFLVQLIGFTSWLQSQKIKYLIWNQCNKFPYNDIKDYKACNKQKWADNDPCIIDLFSFCANRYLYTRGSKLTDSKIPEVNHYKNEDIDLHLKPYLQNYITKNNLGINL